MKIAVGSSTSTASRSTSTALLSTIRTARPSRERLFSSHTLGSSQNANCAASPTSSPESFSSPGRRRGVTKMLLRSKHDTSWFAVFFASLRLCVSHTHPSHGLRGPCYGVVLRKCLGSPSPPVGGEGDLRHSKRHGIRNINVPTTDLVLHRYYQLKISSLRYQRCSKHPSPKGHLIHHPKIPSK